MNSLRQKIADSCAALAAQILHPDTPIKHGDSRFSHFCLASKEQLIFLGRFKHVTDWTKERINQLNFAAEFSPWFRFGLPEMLIPLVVIEYHKMFLMIMPEVLPCSSICQYTMLDKIKKYGLRGDVFEEAGEFDYFSLSRNLSYLDETEEHSVIYDPGAPRLLDKFMMPDDILPEHVKERQQQIANFRLKQQPDRKDYEPQIALWRKRGYDLRNIYDKAEKFAAATGGKVVMAANPNIVKPSGPIL